MFGSREQKRPRSKLGCSTIGGGGGGGGEKKKKKNENETGTFYHLISSVYVSCSKLHHTLHFL
jgi:hypothetical protein